VNVVFRADGSSTIGTGHVIRSIALAQALQQAGFACCFVMRMLDEQLPAVVRNAGIEVHGFDPDAEPEKDAAFLLENVSTDDIVILDGYRFESRYQKMVKDNGNVLVSIDDIAATHFYADIVINHSVHAAASEYDVVPYTKLLLGPAYALLRAPFLVRRDSVKEIAPSARNVMITLGGADPENCMIKILRAASRLEGTSVRAVVGSAFRYKDEIRAFGASSGIEVLESLTAEGMAELMQWADMAVTAAGGTCWELCCMGVPFIAGVLADNQERIAERLDEIGAAVNIGWFNDSSEEEMTAVFREVAENPARRARLHAAAKKLVDGRSFERIRAVIDEKRSETA